MMCEARRRFALPSVCWRKASSCAHMTLSPLSTPAVCFPMWSTAKTPIRRLTGLMPSSSPLNGRNTTTWTGFLLEKRCAERLLSMGGTRSTGCFLTSLVSAIGPSDGQCSPMEAALRRQRSTGPAARVKARGKFLFANGQKLYLHGVTYGTFRPQADGTMFPPPEVVEADFRGMIEARVNSIRTYTVPPAWLLDLAVSFGLYVLVGIPWEQHVRFLDDRKTRKGIERTIRDAVDSCGGHPAVVAYLVGNEIPAPIVRWYGRRRIEAW